MKFPSKLLTKPRRASRVVVLGWVAGLAPRLAQAHDGHGHDGVPHWHAWDVGGLALLALAAAVVVMLLWGRRK